MAPSRISSLGLLINDGAYALAAHLDDAAGGALRGDDGVALFDRVDHGLFAIYILARIHGVDGGLRVPVVGGGDDDGIDVFAREQLVIVRRDEDVFAEDFAGARAAAGVKIGDGYQGDAGERRGRRARRLCRVRRGRWLRAGCGCWRGRRIVRRGGLGVRLR